MNTDLKPYLQQVRYRDVGVIAKATGVPLTTVLKIRGGQTSDPGVKTWAAIAKYFGFSISAPKSRR